VEVRTPLSLKPAAEKERFVRIPPQTNDFYRGVLADTSIQPIIIGGIWYPNVYDSTSDKGRNVVLYFHGGAFVIGEGRSALTSFAATTLCESLPQYEDSLFLIQTLQQHRLSIPSGGPGRCHSIQISSHSGNRSPAHRIRWRFCWLHCCDCLAAVHR